ncbi:MAG: restriction endonuclease subunit S [Candidatus Dadabacteria bacterium]|nr:restriction endonuclease subunit S [Candidatus Dadabacteria bacterium]MDE0476795.1 restriction endonuclease subunit S [Candidatus Dadabacteria bacterium]
MELKPGYKQTEVSPIPADLHAVITNPQRFNKDWEIKRLGDFADCVAGGTPSTLNKEYWGGSIRWMSSSELNNKIIQDVEKRITERGLRESNTKIIPPRCVLIGLAGQGKTRGTVAINLVEICTNQSIAAIYPNESFVPEYLYYNLDARYHELRGMSAGDGGRGGLNLQIIRSIFVPFPDITEQYAIAKVLSDVDGLLAALEVLIVKKRAIKRAAMHQLLTGRMRLREFNGEWRTKKLRDLLAYQRPDNYIVQSTEDAKHGEIPVLTANKSFVLHYTDEEFGVCSDVPVIVFDDFTTDCKYVTFPFKVKSSAIKLLHANHDRISLRYVYERMKLVHFPLVTHKRYYISEYQNIEFFVPSYDEQVAIVSVLSDMDAEIAALEQRRAKIADLKKAMMQELLTGKTRLVEPQALDEQTDAALGNAKGHNWAINEAVVIATLVKHFGGEDYPLGRKRYTKLSYLLHRHVEREADGYLKKAAGPYNPQTKYGGPEKIAKQNGYITQHKGLKGHSGFIAADNIAQAEGYFEKWYGPEVIQWLEQFRYKKNDDLELLATVDMAALELRASGKSVTVAAVKDVITSHPEWEAKLDRTAFSDANIAEAIKQSDALLGAEIAGGSHA